MLKYFISSCGGNVSRVVKPVGHELTTMLFVGICSTTEQPVHTRRLSCHMVELEVSSPLNYLSTTSRPTTQIVFKLSQDLKSIYSTQLLLVFNNEYKKH